MLPVSDQYPASDSIKGAPDGGLLMTATEERLDPTNPEHLRRARVRADALLAATGYKSGK